MHTYLDHLKRLGLFIGITTGLLLQFGTFAGVLAQRGFSLTSMAGVSVDMPKNAVEKLSGNKITVKNDFTPVRVLLDGEAFDITFHTFSDGSRHVYRISTQSEKVRSDKGIGVGSPLLSLWNGYKDQKYMILKSRSFFEYYDRFSVGDYSFCLYTPRVPNDGYFLMYTFFMDRKTDKVLGMTLGRSEDPN